MPADVVELNERRLKKLKPAQLAREIMSLPAKRRIELIVDRPDAESVVHALDANDFFHTVQEIGADDSLTLLALASFEQIDHLFDIEWWRKDTLEPAKALAWMERLRKASGPGLLNWISNSDFELLVSLFKQWITVDIVPEDIDLVEAAETLPPKTLDDQYFWESRYPQFDDLITHILSLIFETNYGFYKELMNSILYASPVELEESAYHFHRARLEDHGIPDFYDALEIYRSIRQDEFAVKPIAEKGDEDQPVPSFALAILRGGDLLARVISRIEDRGLFEGLQIEMAALSNKVIVADQLPPDNSEALRRAVEKALAYVNLGLELLSAADIEKAEEIIRDNFLEHLFRFAQAEVARIRGRIQAIVQRGWLKQYPAGIKCLDEPWLDFAEELLAKTPKVPQNVPGKELPGSPAEFEFFRTPGDLARADYIIDVITSAGDLCQMLDACTGGNEQRLWTGGQVRTQADITLGVMVLTAAANSLVSGSWIAEPLSHKTWPEVFQFLQPHEIDRTVMDWVRRSITDGNKRALIEAYLTPILSEYASEMGPFSELNPPDAEMVKFFMFRE